MKTRTENRVPKPCTCTAVRRASRVLARAFDAALLEAGMNVTQLAVLRAVERHEGEPLSRVAEDLCMDRTSLYRAVGTMRRTGWVEVGAGPNARARTATVTAQGRRMLRSAAPGWADTQTRIVERFGRRRWAKLADELECLAGYAEQIAENGS